MTTARLTKRRTVLERHRAEVVALVVEGKTDAQIARFYQCSREAVSKFRGRHAAHILNIQAQVERLVEDYAIAHKVARIAAKDMRWQLLEQLRQARAKGETGAETGLLVRQFKALGSGKNMQVVEEWKIDPAYLSGMDDLERGASEELGQMPRPDVQVGNTNTFILQVVGVQTKELG